METRFSPEYFRKETNMFQRFHRVSKETKSIITKCGHDKVHPSTPLMLLYPTLGRSLVCKRSRSSAVALADNFV